MIEVTILIPIADNDGMTFAAPHHRQFEAVLLDHFGGFTRFPWHAIGGWVGNGQTFSDATAVYLVAVEGLVGNDALREAIRFAKRHYRQEAIFLRYLGVAEVI